MNSTPPFWDLSRESWGARSEPLPTLSVRKLSGVLKSGFQRVQFVICNSEHECTADDGRARAPSAQRVRARRELRSEPLAAAQRAPEPRFFHA